MTDDQQRRHGSEQGEHRGAAGDRAHLQRPRATEVDVGEVAPGRHGDDEADRAERRDQADLTGREPEVGQDDRDERVEDAERDDRGP